MLFLHEAVHQMKELPTSVSESTHLHEEYFLVQNVVCQIGEFVSTRRQPLDHYKRDRSVGHEPINSQSDIY